MLTLSNGIYGHRLHNIANVLNINSRLIECDVKEKITIKDIENNIRNETHISLTHHETSNGIVNEIEEIAEYSKINNKITLIDGISGLGGIPIESEKIILKNKKNLKRKILKRKIPSKNINFTNSHNG